MKTFSKLAVAALTLTTALSSTSAIAANTAVGAANAAIILPIAITHAGAGIAFGSFSSTHTAGTITVDAAGARSSTGGIFVLAGSTTSEDTFGITGEIGQSYSVTLPAIGVQIAPIPGAPSPAVTLGSFVKADSLTTGQIDSGEILSVGGTLTVPADSPNGVYTYTYNVEVNYL